MERLIITAPTHNDLVVISNLLQSHNCNVKFEINEDNVSVDSISEDRPEPGFYKKLRDMSSPAQEVFERLKKNSEKHFDKEGANIHLADNKVK